MKHHQEFTAFGPPEPPRQSESIIQKIDASRDLLMTYASSEIVASEITHDAYINGEVPRLSRFDRKYLPDSAQLIRLPEEAVEQMKRTRSHDLREWNMPAAFLRRLVVGQEAFQPPTVGASLVMDRLKVQKRVVSFSNLNVDTQPPDGDRQSRTAIYENLSEQNIMGRGRLPFGVGSVPDVGSVLAYTTAAQANAMVFIARDKVLSDVDMQIEVVKRVVDNLRSIIIPDDMMPTEPELQAFWTIIGESTVSYCPPLARQRYVQELRNSWIANVGAAIEASPKGLERAKRVIDAGAQMIRIYSPEGGLEIPRQTDSVRQLPEGTDICLVGGQLMDVATAVATESAGADGGLTGVAGGSQCSTAANANIPVNTPHLLYDLRGRLKIPIGVEGGGVGGNLMGAFLLGASFLLKPGEIGVSYEGAGGKYVFQDSKGDHYMLYGGEASSSSKDWRDLVDTLGRPNFVEGAPGVRKFTDSDPDNRSLTGNLKRLKQQLAIALVFQRVHNLSEMHQRDCNDIIEGTPEVQELGRPYAH